MSIRIDTKIRERNTWRGSQREKIGWSKIERVSVTRIQLKLVTDNEIEERDICVELQKERERDVLL